MVSVVSPLDLARYVMQLSGRWSSICKNPLQMYPPRDAADLLQWRSQ
jgi:hypothetical protein